MADIVLSSRVRSNLLALQQTSDLVSQTQNRLATGKKVNSALDNPTNYFTASALSSRASDLTNLLDSVSNALKTIEAANNGLTSIQKLIDSATATARQALQSSGSNAKVTGTNTTALTGASTFTATAGHTITVNDGTTTATFTAVGGGTDTVQNVIDAINNTSGIKVKASLNSSGQIYLENQGSGNIVIGGTATSTELSGIGLAAGTTTGSLNSTRQTLAAQFDTLRTQIDQLAKDAGFNGKNLLNGDSLTVVFNEKTSSSGQQSSLSISGVTYNSKGLGITGASAANSGNDFQSDTEINNAITNLTNATSSIRTQASTLGSNLSVVQTRQDFTKNMVNTLQTGADSLTLADMNTESANMLALQTRQQLSTTALSLSNQADQGVLRLFG